MATAKTGTTLTAYCINFIDKDNTRRILLRLGKEVTHTGSADADKHFYEVRAANAKEGHAGFTGYGTGQQGFTSPRRAKEQYAFWYLGTDVIVFTRIAEKFNNF